MGCFGGFLGFFFNFFIFMFLLIGHLRATFRYFVNTAPDPTMIEIIVLIQFLFIILSFQAYIILLVAAYVNG